MLDGGAGLADGFETVELPRCALDALACTQVALLPGCEILNTNDAALNRNLTFVAGYGYRKAGSLDDGCKIRRFNPEKRSAAGLDIDIDRSLALKQRGLLSLLRYCDSANSVFGPTVMLSLPR